MGPPRRFPKLISKMCSVDFNHGPEQSICFVKKILGQNSRTRLLKCLKWLNQFAISVNAYPYVPDHTHMNALNYVDIFLYALARQTDQRSQIHRTIPLPRVSLKLTICFLSVTIVCDDAKWVRLALVLQKISNFDVTKKNCRNTGVTVNNYSPEKSTPQ